MFTFIGKRDLGWSVEVSFSLDGGDFTVTPPSKDWIETWGYSNGDRGLSKDGVPPRHHSMVVTDLEVAIRAVAGRLAELHGINEKPGGDLRARKEIKRWQPVLADLRRHWQPPTVPRPVRPYPEAASFCCGPLCAGLPHVK